MRITTVIIGLLTLTIGCNNPAQNKPKIDYSANPSSDISHNKEVDSFIYVPTEALWKYEFDTIEKEFKPVKLKQFSKDTLTIQKVEKIINKTWPKVQIKYLRISKDTIFISISDSEFLTQRMGTTGFDQFIVSTTYSFTEVPEIKYVSYDFERGEHGSPGVYNRNSWTKKK